MNRPNADFIRWSSVGDVGGMLNQCLGRVGKMGNLAVPVGLPLPTS